MTTNNPNITILGIGNLLYSDEGIGGYCIPFLQEYFKDNENIQVENGSTDGLMLLPYVEDTNNLIIIDAINGGKEEGYIHRVVGDDIPKYFGVKMSIHQMGFSEVLAAAQFREKYPENIVLLGMQPYSLALNPDVTPEGKEKAKELIQLVIKQVEEWQ